jgi:purine nucleosidase/pyrimidine-specific ribonucleoside hydrolase
MLLLPQKALCAVAALKLLAKESTMNDRNLLASPMHLIWDTDGTADSVLALCYFLQHPHVVVEALTVSCGEAYPEIYTPKLRALLARLGREALPVGAGRATPLAGNNAFPEPWRDRVTGFFGLELPKSGAASDIPSADELLVELLNASKDPVTLFVAGTHTNVAGALRLDPGIATKIAAVYVMGGALYRPGNIAPVWPAVQNYVAEWNIWVDALAAAEVWAAGLPMHLTPLDATDQVLWTVEDAARWEATGTPEGKVAAEILRDQQVCFRDIYPDGVIMWDLVTAVNATHPELFRREDVHVEIVTGPGPEQGWTRVVPGRAPNTTACLEPQTDEVKRVVTEVLGLSRPTG